MSSWNANWDINNIDESLQHAPPSGWAPGLPWWSGSTASRSSGSRWTRAGPWLAGAASSGAASGQCGAPSGQARTPRRSWPPRRSGRSGFRLTRVDWNKNIRMIEVLIWWYPLEISITERRRITSYLEARISILMSISKNQLLHMHMPFPVTHLIIQKHLSAESFQSNFCRVNRQQFSMQETNLLKCLFIR